METFSVDFMQKVINRFVPFPTMLRQMGLGEYSYDTNCFCPFHENENTPSAKLYRDKDGDKLWCFAEHRTYRPADVLKPEMSDIPLHGLFHNVWELLTSEQREEVQSEDGVETKSSIQWEGYREFLGKFREGKVTLDQHIAALVNIVSMEMLRKQEESRRE